MYFTATLLGVWPQSVLLLYARIRKQQVGFVEIVVKWDCGHTPSTTTLSLFFPLESKPPFAMRAIGGIVLFLCYLNLC